MSEVTRPEQELLSLLKRGNDQFQLTITGHWQISLMAPRLTRRGIGETFFEAWEDAKLDPTTFYFKDIAERASAERRRDI